MLTTDIRSQIRKYLPYPVKAAVRYSRRVARATTGRDHLLRCDIHIPKVRLGTDDGDWVVAEQHLGQDSIVYSVGLGNNISFDLALIERYACQVFGFDPTPYALRYLGEISLPPQMRVEQFGLSTYDGVKNFGAPVTADTPSFSSHLENDLQSLPVLTLSSMMSKLGHSHVDLLKMDIEGDEYDVVPQILEKGILPDQLLVEFHYGIYGIELSQALGHLQLLRRAGYLIFSISPVGREFSFIHQRALQAN
jgi:FkbM family methyltransferase